MASYLGDCRLCFEKNIEIRKSHIVPEFAYEKIYNQKHVFKPIAIDNKNIKWEQCGYRERLLCQKCETKLSLWEGSFSLVVKELSAKSYQKLTVTETAGIELVGGFNYLHIKLAVLSIFWRMSISKLHMFSEYELGPYAELFRNILHEGSFVSQNEYSIVISRLNYRGSYYPGVLMPLSRGRYDGCITIQSLVLNGFLIELHVNDGRYRKPEVEYFHVRESGKFILACRNLEEVYVNLGSLAKRFREPDVISFFNKT